MVIGDSGVPFGRELGGVALPERVLPLPADREVVADPEVALAVEHRLAACAVAPAIELERQHPGAGRETQVGHEGHGPHGLALGDRIERVEQVEQPLGLIPRRLGYRLRRRQRVGRSAASRWRGGREELVASIRRHRRHASCQHVGQRREVGHRRGLAAIERVLDGFAPPAGGEIDEAGHIACSDPQPKRMSLDGVAVEELRVGPHRRDCRHLVDRDFGRGLATQHRHEGDGWIIAARLIDSRFATRGDEVKAGVDHSATAPPKSQTDR